ncbi:MAG: hypothetical protein SFU84_13965 [Gemmatimonadales bacterium]|nr:hypothetical protein [Gemmatimonadales bacterium]
MSEKPVTEVKGSEVEADLSRVWQPHVLSDGRIVMYADGSVLVFGPEGELIERIGREGAGPNEFRGGIVRPGLGDTLLVEDGGNSRLSFIVPGQGVVRSIPIPEASQRGWVSVIGQSADGGFLLATTGFAFTPDLVKTPVVQWRSARLDPGADSVVFLDSIPGPQLAMRNGGPDIVRNAPLPVTTVWDGDFLVSRAAHWVLMVLRPNGSYAARIVVPGTRRAIDPAGIEAEVAAQLPQTMAAIASGRIEGRAPDSATMRKSLLEAPRSDSLPLIAKALIGPDGVAWIKDGGYMFAEPTWAWTAVRKDGTILGRLVGKGKDPVVAFGANRVLLKSEDEDGSVTFRVHVLTTQR